MRKTMIRMAMPALLAGVMIASAWAGDGAFNGAYDVDASTACLMGAGSGDVTMVRADMIMVDASDETASPVPGNAELLLARGGQGKGKGKGGRGPGDGTGNGGNGPKDGTGNGRKSGTCVNS